MTSDKMDIDNRIRNNETVITVKSLFQSPGPKVTEKNDKKPMQFQDGDRKLAFSYPTRIRTTLECPSKSQVTSPSSINLESISPNFILNIYPFQ